MPWSAGAVLTAAQLNTYLPQAWSTFSPVLSAETGSYSNASPSNGRYIAYGKTIHWSLTITIVSAGTAAGAVRFALPVTAAMTGAYIGNGREGASTGAALVCFNASTTTASVLRYDNATIIASGRTLSLSGTYEAA